MSPYPAQVEAAPPPRFDRAQLALRILILILLGGVLGISVSWLFGLLYLALPIGAAILAGAKGDRYLPDDGPRLVRGLGWFAGFFAYMMLVSDRFPVGPHRADVTLLVVPEGRPTIAGALVRVITGLPSVIVLALLGFVSGIIWLISAVWILISANYPGILRAYQLGVLRWSMRLLAYQASLVAAYPPFRLDVETEAPVPLVPV